MMNTKSLDDVVISPIVEDTSVSRDYLWFQSVEGVRHVFLSSYPTRDSSPYYIGQRRSSNDESSDEG